MRPTTQLLASFDERCKATLLRGMEETGGKTEAAGLSVAVDQIELELPAVSSGSSGESGTGTGTAKRARDRRLRQGERERARSFKAGLAFSQDHGCCTCSNRALLRAELESVLLDHAFSRQLAAITQEAVRTTIREEYAFALARLPVPTPSHFSMATPPLSPRASDPKALEQSTGLLTGVSSSTSLPSTLACESFFEIIPDDFAPVDNVALLPPEGLPDLHPDGGYVDATVLTSSSSSFGESSAEPSPCEGMPCETVGDGAVLPGDDHVEATISSPPLSSDLQRSALRRSKPLGPHVAEVGAGPLGRPFKCGDFVRCIEVDGKTLGEGRVTYIYPADTSLIGGWIMFDNGGVSGAVGPYDPSWFMLVSGVKKRRRRRH